MSEQDEVYIAHIKEAVQVIEEYVNGMNQEDFLGDQRTQDAVVRRLEIIGEAAKNLSSEAREAYPSVPWPEVTGMRDVLIHRYFGVDLEAVWDTVQEDIPTLGDALG